MRKIAMLGLASVSLFPLASPALAQVAEPGLSNEIIVQARRKDESVQDVPLVVQAVTSDELTKLNVRDFKEIQSLVPGLNMSSTPNGIQNATTLRGVNYDVTASGNNGTVEFYLNDSPISAGLLFTSMFDVGQIEVLRGPQGTLRGRASPSGSITVTTRKPDLSEVGGYAQGTLNDLGGWNVNGAVNVPIIADKLAVRVAGLIDENDGNEVSSINSSANPFSKSKAIRASVQFDPFDFLSLGFVYANLDRENLIFEQAESANLGNPLLAPALVAIKPSDRLSVMRAPRTTSQNFTVYNWQAEARFLGQKLNYVGSSKKQRNFSEEPADRGAVYGAGFPSSIYEAGLYSFVHSTSDTHEVRLSSDERIAGIFDYVVGYLNSKSNNPTDLTNDTLVWYGAPQPSTVNLLASIVTPIFRFSNTKEESYFANITAHLGDATEISGGMRHIKFRDQGALAQGCFTCINTATIVDKPVKGTIYSASVKHRFNDSLMAYASYGGSFRPGGSTNATLLRNLVITPFYGNLLIPEPEKSNSYEIGIKSDWLDRRLRLNVSAFHQTFKNFQYFQKNVFAAGTALAGGANIVEPLTGLAVGVPAKVDGVEMELMFDPSERFSLGVVAAYSKSKVKNGSIPCNDFYNNGTGAVGSDGTPDIKTANFADIMAATANNGVAFCKFNGRAGIGAPFSATVQSEYNHPLGENLNGYIRGLLTYTGNSQNDPTNPIDDVKGYGLLNLFAGLRGGDGAWEIGGYVKNLLDTGRVLYRESTPYAVQVRSPGAATVFSNYRYIEYTAPREFGITARMTFGSR